MTVHDETIAKIRQLPESLVQEVNDFVDFLLMKQDSDRGQLFAKELIVDTSGHIRKVVIDINDYQRLLEAIEDEGLTLAMMEAKDEIPLSLDEALAELEKV